MNLGAGEDFDAEIEALWTAERDRLLALLEPSPEQQQDNERLAEFWAAERADLLALLDGLRLDLDMIEGLSD